MNGHRKESTGNQKAGWLAPSILSARTSYSQWERFVLCAIYYFPDPVGGGRGNSLPTQGSNRKSKGFTGTSKGKPKGTTRNTKSNQQEIKWFQQEITRHQQEIHSHEWTQKGTHRKSKGWMACAINSERTNVHSQWERVLCAIYYFHDPVGGVKHCAINSERTPILLPTGA